MSDQSKNRRGLGRGLSALMADIGVEPPRADEEGDNPKTAVSIRLLPLEALHPNPDQPRRSFAPDAMDDLARSISEKGILQPLIVRPLPQLENQYQIVAGERRWRAAQKVPLHEVPAIVRSLSDEEVLEIAIIENIQRTDLDPIEEATGYKQLIDTFGHTQEKLASALGKSRSYIANLLRLLALPDQVQSMLVDRSLSVGHARALITATDPVGLAEKIVAEGLSVRATEELARQNQSMSPSSSRQKKKSGKDADTRVLETDLTAALGMGVVIDHQTDGAGTLSIRYKSLDQLDQLCQLLSVR